MSVEDINYLFNITLLQYILSFNQKMERNFSDFNRNQEIQNLNKVEDLCSPIHSISENNKVELDNFLFAMTYLINSTRS